MEQGEIAFEGSTAAATARYYAESLKLAGSGADLRDRPREGSGKARFQSITIHPQSSDGEALEMAFPGCDLRVELELECHVNFSECLLAVIFYDANGYRVIDTNTAQQGEFISLNSGQKARATFLLRDVLLKPGQYYVGVWLGRQAMETVDHIENAILLDVAAGEESKQHSIVYPGVYLCRFEKRISIH